MARGEQRQPKIGEGHAAAMLRQGLRELRAAVYPESNVAQTPEYGLYGTLTPGEIADDRRMIDRDFDEEPGRESIAEEQGLDLEQDRIRVAIDVDLPHSLDVTALFTFSP